jgi:hypothetical protein
MVSMAAMNNITSVLPVSKFIPHVIKLCQHVHLQQLQQSYSNFLCGVLYHNCSSCRKKKSGDRVAMMLQSALTSKCKRDGTPSC